MYNELNIIKSNTFLANFTKKVIQKNVIRQDCKK